MVEPTIQGVLDGTARWTVVHGDCLELLRATPDNSVDSIVTDPPGAISFMGRKWDGDKGGRQQWVAWLTEIMQEALRVLKPGGYAIVWAIPRTSHWTATALEDAGFEIIDSLHHFFGSGFPKSHNASKAIDEHDFRQWLKANPGAHELHRKSKARKKTGGERGKRVAARVDRMLRRRAGLLRDVVHSYTASGNAGTPTSEKGGTYGVGVANSEAVELHVTRGATERSRKWDGYGTALKPGHEVWWLAQKPIKTTVAANLLEHGTGALNIDGCRVATDWNEPDRPDSWKRSGHTADPDAGKIAAPPGQGIEFHPGGRWPPNVVFTHSSGCKRQGTRKTKTSSHPKGPAFDPRSAKVGGPVYGEYQRNSGVQHVGADGTETVAAWDCAPDCPVRELERQSGELKSGDRASIPTALGGGFGGRGGSLSNQYTGDIGTAARFFPQFQWDDEALELNQRFLYAAKPSRAERDSGLTHFKPHGTARNVHPTVKGDELMRWFCRLVTPRGGVVLDLFTGSGTTGRSAIFEGFRFVGFELNDTDEEPFVSIARARIAHIEGGEIVPRESLRAEKPPIQRSLFEAS